MWLNKFEEKEYGPFSDYIDAHPNEKILFEYKDGSKLIVKDDSGDFESDNGLDLHEQGYEEYWERVFEIIEVIKDDKNIYQKEKYVSVNYHSIPLRYSVIK